MKSHDFIQHVYIVRYPVRKFSPQSTIDLHSHSFARFKQSLIYRFSASIVFHSSIFSQLPESNINMKFFTSIVVSLSLGAQVLAAPINVTSTAVSIPAEAIAAIKAVPASASFAKKSICITTITGAVSNLKGSASYELSSISKTVTPPNQEPC
jgi:hypothetical protein